MMEFIDSSKGGLNGYMYTKKAVKKTVFTGNARNGLRLTVNI